MHLIYGITLLGLLGYAPAPAAARPPTAAEQELINVEHEWNQAVIDRNVTALERFYAAEYMSTDQEGQVWNKKQDLDIDTLGASRLASFKLDDLKVRIYGNTAVVTGRNRSTGTLLGAPVHSEYRFTDMFAKRDGRWQCVASQVTPIVRR